VSVIESDTQRVAALPGRLLLESRQPLPPLGGPLVLWTIGLLLFPIRFAVRVFQDYLPVLGLRPNNVSIGASLHLFPAHGVCFALAMALDISRFGAWLMLVSSYFSRSSSTRRLMVTFLLLGIVQSLLPMIIVRAPVKEHEYDILRAIVMALWLPYLLLSERVRNTFALGPVSRSAVRSAIVGFLVLSVALGGLMLRSYLRSDRTGRSVGSFVQR
jgi:hypothetical protein